MHQSITSNSNNCSGSDSDVATEAACRVCESVAKEGNAGCSDNEDVNLTAKGAAEHIQKLNSACFCISLPDGALKRALKLELAAPEVFDLIEQRCPHLFSAQPVFVSHSQQMRMAAVIQAIERVVALPTFRAQILQGAPEIVRQAMAQNPVAAVAVNGVFFGYDFHLHEEKIGLIEVNTNAGGALLNALLARAQHACCAVMDDIVHTQAKVQEFEQAIVIMFQHEWTLAQMAKSKSIEPTDPNHSASGTLRTIAIVDEHPEAQYLYPEFLLFQQLFQRHGINAIIAAPEQLSWRDEGLWCADQRIDLVYNRLTDFYLEDANAEALRQAYLAQAVVLTPNPFLHALYADKRNLVIWSDPQQLQQLGVDTETQACLLANIPRTETVQLQHAERLWAQRRQLFFKPNAGYGGRAAYRGDKLTKRVWEEILAGDYIAQEIISPGERVSGSPEMPAQMKFDIRQYTYQGAVQWTAARMYQGQTTNFRTPGGGFAPVYTIDDTDLFGNPQKMAALMA
ncbi:hypothetical protein [Undibacterium flavidum]|uniref:hypothetical protein n=1 Tax=Undibacterium flavidum TaxID=2762297 RepID=UPI001E379860|nr:hypothetical protein [Undibacterium flavidum]